MIVAVFASHEGTTLQAILGRHRRKGVAEIMGNDLVRIGAVVVDGTMVGELAVGREEEGFGCDGGAEGARHVRSRSAG